MLTISKNLLWPRDLESFKGGNFNTLSLVDCYVQICNGTVVPHSTYRLQLMPPTQNSSSSTSLVQMRANTHVSLSVTDVVDILDVNYDDLFCDYNTLTSVNNFLLKKRISFLFIQPF
jgi:hypothetical protein